MKGSYRSRHLEITLTLRSAIINLFLLISIPTQAFLDTCSTIGKLERDKSECMVLLPSGRLQKPVKFTPVGLCDTYLASKSEKQGHFLAWKVFQKLRYVGIHYHECSDNGECDNKTFAPQYSIGQCHGPPYKIWIGFLDRWFYGLVICNSTNEEKFSIISDAWEEGYWRLNFFVDLIVPGSLFFGLDIKRYPKRRMYLFLSSRLVDNLAPIIYVGDS